MPRKAVWRGWTTTVSISFVVALVASLISLGLLQASSRLVGALTTEYSVGYRAEMFAQIDGGYDRAAVISALGAPIYVSRPTEAWEYDEVDGPVFLMFQSTIPLDPSTMTCHRLARRDSKGTWHSISEGEWVRLLGMTQDEVIAGLGCPARIEAHRERPEVWQYSRDGFLPWYTRVEVIFDVDSGLVVGKETRLSGG